MSFIIITYSTHNHAVARDVSTGNL